VAFVSEDTVKRAQREKGYYVHIARKKPFRTKRKKSIIYIWYKLRQKWGVERWIYMDESSLTTGRLEKGDDLQELKSPSKIDIWSQLFYRDEFQFAYKLLLPMIIIYH
jgi:hypothetical protein